MKYFLPLFLMTAVLQARPLTVVQVVREGLPPYEDSNRLYRLEGDGCDLPPGRVLLLVRPGERRPLGQLEVVKTGPGFALAKVRRPGATYPMKGDGVVPREALRSLPSLPSSGLPLQAARQPGDPASSVPPALAHREPIFFLPEQGSLSRAARTKLKAWVAAWGSRGHWVLAQPPGQPEPLVAARIAALRQELTRLGVTRIETGTADQAPPGKYPAVFVALAPN